MLSTFSFAKDSVITAIFVESKGSYRNLLRRKMRYNQILVSRISKICYRSKHKVAGKLFEEVDGYGVGKISNFPKYLDKFSVMLGYNNLDCLVNGTQKEAGFVLEDKIDTFDVSSICKKFPSISIGSSPVVELYTDSACHSQTRTCSPASSSEEIQPLLTNGKWIIPEYLTEKCPALDSRLPNTSSLSEKASLHSPDRSQPDGLEEASLPLDKPISSIKGLSKRHSTQLEDCDFHTLRKLLHHFPRTYADLQNSHMGIEDGQYLIFVGRISCSRAIKASYSLSFLEVIVRGEVDHVENDVVERDDIKDEGKKIIHFHLKKFFRGTRFTSQGFLWCLQKKHREGDIVCVSGKVKSTSKEDHYEMREYSLDVIENEDDPSVPIKGRPYPIYPSKGGLKPQFFKDVMMRALQSLPTNIDPVPQDITTDVGIQGLHDAYIAIHQPKDLCDADFARRRFIFDEFFYLQLGRMYQLLEGLGSRIEKEGLLEKYRNIEQSSIFAEEWCNLTKSYLAALPYSLTKSQLSAVSEIIWDLKRPVPMNRLLQGDVGCGKTVVAFLACMEVIGSGYQAAYMVPTELLAIQHYEDLSNLLEKMESAHKPSIALLTGSTSAKQARMIRNELQAGTISLVIGTHSLIADSVEFLALRLAVIDEQHRFGVIQRGRFNSKLCSAPTMSGTGSAAVGDAMKDEIQMAPHILAMSATPIPRSLAFVLYGDVSLTQITDLPPGRLPIETRIVEGDKNGIEKVYKGQQEGQHTPTTSPPQHQHSKRRWSRPELTKEEQQQ
ncbi:ATP-dependent DNA helicase homolog RECG, chloroplastic isoform X3 [Spinacia oleracea]|uniref:ATP-dependent DNA helicase homolog RECG, chloroplastic isoform X3 n=1 Tax=Spinacia oleracea TaxID=3562 RepID=A0ABM3RLY1_SPIOL|nr:ATP-dependent DNA helicase homolog RECG, chloroplastic isoform X3 [Spinacia oleracea]